LADSGASGANAAVVSTSHADTSSAGDQTVPNEQTNTRKSPQHSGESNARPENTPRPKTTPEPKPKNTEKSEAKPEDDDPEEDLDGEKVRRSQLRDVWKRQKDFERASHKRMREAAEASKSAQAQQQELLRVANMLRAKEEGADPFAIHRAAGATEEELDAIAEQRLVQRMKRAQMSPEQIQAEQNANRLAQLERENNEMKESRKKEAHEQLKAKYKQHWDHKIASAMEAGNLARTSSTGAKVANVIFEYANAGEDIDPQLAAQIVRDNHHTEIRHEFTELREQLKTGRITHDKFLAYISDLVGPDTIKAIRQTAIKEAQSFEPQKPKAPREIGPPKKAFTSFEEADAWIAKQQKVKHHG
jgi:hypothetical protein